MRCPACNHLESKVVDSRPTDDGSSIRRRRECLRCAHRFTTYERLGDTSLVVIKSDGSSEAFDRDKLFRGLLIACAKRPVSSSSIEHLIDRIEADLRNRPHNEVKSTELGEMALAQLSQVDDVAYVRFASVYKDFQNIEEFAHALEEIRS